MVMKINLLFEDDKEAINDDAEVEPVHLEELRCELRTLEVQWLDLLVANRFFAPGVIIDHLSNRRLRK